MANAAPTPATAQHAGLSAQAYQQLRVLARARLRRGGRETLLGTTAPVHEAYLRIAGVEMGSAEPGSFLAELP